MSQPIIAIMYDFDRTLSEKDMQEYAFIPSLGMTPEEFWRECDTSKTKYGMDSILAYMYVMIKKARSKTVLTADTLKEQGSKVDLFNGVREWFDLINAEGGKRGFEVQHFVISSGLKKIIEGTEIARYFTRIFACEFCYDEDGVPFWPAISLNYTSKTQFLFRINKGVFDTNEDKKVNEYLPDEKRYIPFKNMIYIGDGLTDVPCMKLTKINGGHSIGVFCKGNDSAAKSLLEAGRVDYTAEADYTRGGKLFNIVTGIINDL